VNGKLPFTQFPLSTIALLFVEGSFAKDPSTNCLLQKTLMRYHYWTLSDIRLGYQRVLIALLFVEGSFAKDT